MKTFHLCCLLFLSFIFSPAQSSVSSIPPTGTPPRIRAFSSLTTVDYKLYTFGGIDKDQALTNEVQEFDLSTNQWRALQSVSQLVPSPRQGSILVSYLGFLYVFGGSDQSGIREELWQFTVASGSWTLLALKHTGPIARYNAGYALVGNLLYVFGGVTLAGADNALLV